MEYNIHRWPELCAQPFVVLCLMPQQCLYHAVMIVYDYECIGYAMTIQNLKKAGQIKPSLGLVWVWCSS